MRGHSGPHVADLIVTALQARPGLGDVKVLREYPADPADLKNDEGEWDAIWVGREGTQDISDIEPAAVFIGDHLTFDETYTLWLTIQCLRNDSDGTQKVATDRANDMYGEVLGAHASDPAFGFVDTDEFSTLHPKGVTSLHRTGRLDAGHAAGFEVGFRLKCRIHLS